MGTAVQPVIDEKAFQRWYAGIAKKTGLNPDPDDPRHFYDYRAAFQAGAKPDSTGHWPSQFKRVGHPNLIVDGQDTRTGASIMDPEIPLQDWIKILHNAARIKPGHAKYAEARQVAQIALANIRGLNQQAGEMDKFAPTQQAPPPTSLSQKVQDVQTGLGIGALQGASSGLGQPIAGALSALQGQGFGAGEQAFQEGLGAVREAAPVSTTVGNIGGALISPLAQVLPAPVGALKGAFTGGVLGGVQGLAEGQGSLSERTPTALLGAFGGALGGAAVGGLVKKLTPLAVMAAKKIRFAPGTSAAEMAIARELAAETAVRAKLARDGYPPHAIEEVVRQLKAGKHIPTAPGPEVPVAQRPGETMVRTAPRGFEVHGTRATPPAPKGGSFWEQLRGTPVRDLGKGKTLPYYPRGGKVEQSMAPFPASSPAAPSVVPQQMQIFIDYLKGASPWDIGARVGTLRDLGIPVPPEAEAQIFQMLFGAH